MFVYIPHKACEYDLTLLALNFYHPLSNPLTLLGKSLRPVWR